MTATPPKPRKNSMGMESYADELRENCLRKMRKGASHEQMEVNYVRITINTEGFTESGNGGRRSTLPSDGSRANP